MRQRDFAKMAGVTPTVVTNLLHGHDPRLSTFEKVDRVLRKLEASDSDAP